MKPTDTITGMFAASKAGHDRGNIYFIIEETEEYVLLADGRIRTTIHPKKKNKRHIQCIKKRCNEALRQKLLAGEAIKDEEIKRAIKLYQMESDLGGM